MRTLVAFLLAFIAATATAADCPNCHGQRIVGAAPVRWPCPVCEGTGEATAVHPPAVVRAAPAPRAAIARVIAAHGRYRHAGTGTLVRVSGTAGIVLTNWHVVDERDGGVTVTWPDGTEAPARVLAADRQWDLAALAVPRPAGVEPVPIAAAAPRIGERLTIAGYGSGVYREQAGEVTQYMSPARSNVRQFLEIRAAARNGDSGGPMLTADGELAGVLWGSTGGLTAGSCATRVAAFLDAVPGPQAACADGRCSVR